jgi:hypothetical protein
MTLLVLTDGCAVPADEAVCPVSADRWNGAAMGRTGRERQAALAERRRAAGLVPITVWAPAGRTTDLAAYAKALYDGNAPAVSVLEPPSPLMPEPASPVSADETTISGLAAKRVQAKEPYQMDIEDVPGVRLQPKTGE